MPRLTNLKEEAYCQLVASLGWSRTDAYEAVGHVRDRSNASKYGDRPELAARLRELQSEREKIQAGTAKENLQRVVEMGFTSNDLAPVVSALRVLGESDGSLAQQKSAPEEMPIAEMLKLAAS